MIQMKLTQIFEAQIKYVDGDKNHPFLEEIVSIFASFFESQQSYHNALLMWGKLLRIQQEMFGEDREQMVTTYRKMASICISIGEPSLAQKYFKKIEELTKKYAENNPNMSAE